MAWKGIAVRRIQHPILRRAALLVLVCSLLNVLPWRSHAAPRSAYDLAAESPWGLNTHLATRYPAPGHLDKPAARVAQLGIGWAREDFAWPRIEPRSGTWDWRLTDEMIAVHTAHDVHVLGRLGYSVGWATADTTDAPSEQSFSMPNIRAWERYIRATVMRYGDRVDHWEIWNEPDNAPFWKGKPDPKAYAILLQSAYRTIKAVDPDAVVLNGGVSPFDTRYLTGLAEAGAWDAFDVLALHPYTDPVGPEDGQIAPSGIGGVRGLLNRYGTKPIWVTEGGAEFPVTNIAAATALMVGGPGRWSLDRAFGVRLPAWIAPVGLVLVVLTLIYAGVGAPEPEQGGDQDEAREGTAGNGDA